jgi:hypothetical protein
MATQVSLPVQTVEGNEKLFTERQRKNAETARQAQMRMGYPNVQDIMQSISKGRINKFTNY